MTRRVSADPERQVVLKRYPGSSRDEAAREWRALRLLAEHAPRLAPEPISADLDAMPPSIVMSLLPGDPLGGRALTPATERALSVAVGRLWQSVPVGLVTPLPGEPGMRQGFVRRVRSSAAAVTAAVTDADADSAVRRALVRGVGWLACADLGGGLTEAPAAPQVLGHGDANLANFLWDGELVRIVDFEDSGVSDRPFELAMLVEHVSAWRDSALDADRFTGEFDLSMAERARLTDWRRLAALHWLLLLRQAKNSGQAEDLGSLERQAERLLSLL